MCNFFKRMKSAFIVRFNRKPILSRVTGILCWSFVLVLSALMLGGHFVLAAAFASLVALFYLAVVFVCKKVEEANARCMADNCTYTAHRTVGILLDRFKDLAQSEQAKEEQESCEACRSAILNARKTVDKMHEMLDNLHVHLCKQVSMLKDFVLPELGIYVSDTKDDWVQCDALGSEIPYGLISVRISNRLKSVGINTFAELVQCSESVILCIPDFGSSSLERVKQLLDLMGLHLDMVIKQEDGIWYYKREDAECIDTDMEKPFSAEDEILAEGNDNNDEECV